MKKIILYILCVFIVLISLVTAWELNTYVFNQVELGDFVINGSSGEFLTDQICNISIINSTYKLVVNQSLLTNNPTGFHNYTWIIPYSDIFIYTIRCNTGTFFGTSSGRIDIKFYG